jgi:hypothetical protein
MEAQLSSVTGRFLRRSAAAEYLTETHGLPTAKQTLARWAVEGVGPEFQKWGRVVLYPVRRLDDWAMSRLTPPTRSSRKAA